MNFHLLQVIVIFLALLLKFVKEFLVTVDLVLFLVEKVVQGSQLFVRLVVDFLVVLVEELVHHLQYEHLFLLEELHLICLGPSSNSFLNFLVLDNDVFQCEFDVVSGALIA